MSSYVVASELYIAREVGKGKRKHNRQVGSSVGRTSAVYQVDIINDASMNMYKKPLKSHTRCCVTKSTHLELWRLSNVATEAVCKNSVITP